jgi:Holliday junction resolvase RusA-like endonuclease
MEDGGKGGGERVITFFTVGIPKTAGSKRGWLHPKTKKIIMTDDSGAKGKDWRTDLQCSAIEAMQAKKFPEPLTGPLQLHAVFYLPRPQSHYGKRKGQLVLKETAPFYHTVKPDATKMLRALEDALTSIVWRDDSLIAVQSVEKRYCDEWHPMPGVEVAICQATEKREK